MAGQFRLEDFPQPRGFARTQDAPRGMRILGFLRDKEIAQGFQGFVYGSSCFSLRWGPSLLDVSTMQHAFAGNCGLDVSPKFGDREGCCESPCPLDHHKKHLPILSEFLNSSPSREGWREARKTERTSWTLHPGI